MDERASERAGGVPRRRASCSHRGNCRALMNLKPPPPLLPPPLRCRLSSFYSSLFSHHSIQFGNLAPPRKRRRRRTNRPSLRPSTSLSVHFLPASRRLSSSARCLARQSANQTVRFTHPLATPYTLFPSRSATLLIFLGEGRGGGNLLHRHETFTRRRPSGN